MYRRDPTSPPTQFSVHAEFTISHPGADDPRNRPRTSTERDESTGGVRMTYTWQPEWSSRAQSEDRTSEGAGPPSASNSNNDTPLSPRSIPPRITPPSAMFDTDYTRGYQKGNLFFTSNPPPKTLDDVADSAPPANDIPKAPRLSSAVQHDAVAGRGLIHDSSGYGSDLLSPNSQGGSLPRRILQPYDRKCRSTCNITLSTNLTGCQDPSCGRSRSLRCQTPSSSLQRNPLRFYGCGDPWCHHLRQGEDFTTSGRISPVPEENTPISTKLPTRSNTYTIADHQSSKKDASVQTFEMVDKCTSPFLRMNSTDSVEGKNVRKYQRRGLTEPIWRHNRSPGGASFTPDSLESVQVPKRLVKSPKLQRLPGVDKTKKPLIEPSIEPSPPNEPLKKPRTVHIDVYCSGTEMESSASSDSSDEDSKTASTPQTVFENTKMRVTHRKAGEQDLPFFLRKKEEPKLPGIKSFETISSVEKDESDDENASTAYPSKMSSYSNIGDYSASISSVPRSWTTYSMSSCAIPEDYDSVANTSWKDTYSDVDSVLMSRSSIAPTESLDFVPRKLYETAQSIDETPEYAFDRKNVLETPSVTSIQPSDSFEYANSEDRLRIRQMEEMWKNRGSLKSLKSPIDEHKLQMQQKRMQEYMDKKIRDKEKWGSKDSDSNESDDSGKGWTFLKTPHTVERVETIKRKSPVTTLPNTVRDAFLRSVTPQKTPSPEVGKNLPPPRKKKPTQEDQGSLSDSSPTSRSTNKTSLKQRLSLDPNVQAPFMVVPGIYTEPRSIARKFGTVVSVMKKPGHHVGPAKNPDCLCDHCQTYWESVGCRNRTRSMGDPPRGKFIQNWKEFLEQQTGDNRGKHDKAAFSDF